MIGSNTGIFLTIPKTASYRPLAFYKDDVAYVTESARDELASLIASFNKAWNLVRLNLDQQGTILLCNVIPLHMYTPGSSLIANNCLTLIELLRRLDCFEGD